MPPNLRQNNDAADTIAALGLQPHPEGGWYRETWRAAAATDGRSAVTAIHYLLEAGQVSRWHRVDADEIWCWHAGASLALGVAADDATPADWRRLGSDLAASESPQVIVPAGYW